MNYNFTIKGTIAGMAIKNFKRRNGAKGQSHQLKFMKENSDFLQAVDVRQDLYETLEVGEEIEIEVNIYTRAYKDRAYMTIVASDIKD